MNKKSMVLGLIAGIACALSVFAFSSFTPSDNKTYATFSIYMFNAVYDSRIVIAYENGSTEEIKLEKHKPDNYLTNTTKVNEAINKMANKGYKVVASTGGDVFSTLVFEKN